MATARNQVIAGDYVGHDIFTRDFPYKYIGIAAKKGFWNFIRAIGIGASKKKEFSNIELCVKTVEKYEVVRSSGIFEGSRSAFSGFYQVEIYFRDGKKSLIEISPLYFDYLQRRMFMSL